MNYLDITIEEAKNYAKVDEDDSNLVPSLIIGCKAYLLSYTGLTEEAAQKKADLKLVLLALIKDAYDNRGLLVDNMQNILKNPMIECIMNMYGRNGIA